jgi:threonine synthase
MDILISSNLERLIYRIAGNDAEKNSELMKSLAETGKYEITDEMKKNLYKFYGNFATTEEVASTIHNVYAEDGYVLDTHTAVAVNVYDKYKADTEDDTPTIIASTASPYKFARSVVEALVDTGNESAKLSTDSLDDFALVDELEKLSAVKIPQAVEEIRTAPVMHETVCDKEEMESVVKNFLGI